MSYYDALIAKWATLTPIAAKLAQINGLTVPTGAPAKVLIPPSAILNAFVPADLAAQTTVALLTLLLAGSTVDASQGTTVRAGIQAIFSGKPNTLTALGALVAPFDAPAIPWWKSNGYMSPISANNLAASPGGLS